MQDPSYRAELERRPDPAALDSVIDTAQDGLAKMEEAVSWMRDIESSASEILETIVSGVKQVGEAIGEMVAGMAEQSRASGEIVEAVERIHEMTRHIREASGEIDQSTSDEQERFADDFSARED